MTQSVRVFQSNTVDTLVFSDESLTKMERLIPLSGCLKRCLQIMEFGGMVKNNIILTGWFRINPNFNQSEMEIDYVRVYR